MNLETDTVLLALSDLSHFIITSIAEQQFSPSLPISPIALTRARLFSILIISEVKTRFSCMVLGCVLECFGFSNST